MPTTILLLIGVTLIVCVFILRLRWRSNVLDGPEKYAIQFRAPKSGAITQIQSRWFTPAEFDPPIPVKKGELVEIPFEMMMGQTGSFSAPMCFNHDGYSGESARCPACLRAADASEEAGS